MNSRIRALKRNDLEAWSDVYNEYVDVLYRYVLYRLHGDKPTAEDVVQEVFVRALESIHAYRGEGDGLLRWLRGISRRVMARRSRSSEGCHDGAARPDPAQPAYEQLLQEEKRHLTGAALTSLPPHWEKALRWKYCDSLHIDEIARRMGISYKAAESLLSRARSAFRTMYERLALSDGRIHEVEDLFLE